MNRLILWLTKRKVFTFALSIAYLAAVSLGHKMVSDFFDWLKEELSFRVYDSVLLMMGVILLSLFLLSLLDRIRRNEGRRAAGIGWWFFTTALVVASYEVLIVFSVETIHFLQYALLAVPVFALTTSFGETVGWVTLMGALDEAYQYFVIYAGIKTVYFDFNDIILNLVGAAIGVLTIYTFSDLTAPPFTVKTAGFKRRALSAPTVVMASLILTGVILHISGIIELYPDASAAPVVLSRKLPAAGFWLNPSLGKTFHILSASQGIPVAVVLIGVYSLMDIYAEGAGKSR